MIERILELMKHKGITAKKLTDDLEISNSTITDWKKGKGRPSIDAIIKLSEYFNVTTDYLLTGKIYNDKKESTYLIYDSNNDKNYNIYVTGEEKSLITDYRKLNDKSKGIILGKIESLLDSYANNKIAELHTEEGKKDYTCNKRDLVIKHLPILGQTAAGPPMDIIEVGGSDYVEVPEKADADYALFVKGDSMAPAINDKDIVFIKSMPEVENGTIGVVDIDGMVTCKKIHRYNGKVELISLNKNYDPIIVNLSETPFRIIGKVMFCKNADSNFFTV